jgi:hypothetical protein
MTSLFAGALLCLAAASPAFANLVANGDFETGDLTGWAVLDTNGDPASTLFTGVNGNNVNGGLFAFETGELAPVTLVQEVAGAAPVQYVFEFWLQRDAADAGDAFLFEAFVNGSSVLAINDGNTDGTLDMPYQRFAFNFTNSDNFLGIAFDFGHEAAFWHLDDVSVNPVAASVDEGSGLAASLLMIVIGAIAVLASRVRTQGATRLV